MQTLGTQTLRAVDNTGVSFMGAMKWIIAIVAVALIVWYGFLRDDDKPPYPTDQSAAEVQPATEGQPDSDGYVDPPPVYRGQLGVPGELLAGARKGSFKTFANARLYLQMREELKEGSGDLFITDEDFAYWSEHMDTFKESGYLDYSREHDPYALDLNVKALRTLYGVYLDFSRYGGCGPNDVIKATKLTGLAISWSCIKAPGDPYE